MSIIDFLKKLFPFLASAAEKTFDDLEDAAKEAGINGSLFAQIIKENATAASTDVKNLIKAKLGLSDELLEALLIVIGQKYDVSSEHIIEYLQAEFATRTDDVLHSSFANEVASVAAIVLSKGKLTWLTLLMGVGEFIYRKYVKGVDVTSQGVPYCAPPKEWNPNTQSCQDPIGK
jgi:hypothetical protein